MRLIDTETLKLGEFFGDQIPRYAILSHTWEEEEVSFQDWSDQSSISDKNGYKKIFSACQLAKKDGYNYMWVDTNCIDKTSSAELTEAINSMFIWYQHAQVCYVYLSDVPPSNAEHVGLEFNGSRWFTRGWTLQELLAPQDVEFYSSNWSLLGTKKSLLCELSFITGINTRYLWERTDGDKYVANSGRQLVAQSILYATPLREASVSERFSWLSNRRTTRLEDMAYCMLGIFELNMPLLYGEGSKAFMRLQEEVMKISDDHSLFCWTWNAANRGGFLSAFASQFKDASRFVPKQEDKRPAPYTFTNAGLSIVLPILHGWDSSFIGVLRVDSFPLGQTFGLPMLGDLKTGRVYRKSFPPEPIPLCDNISGSQDHSVFVSEKYSESSMHSFESSPIRPSFSDYEFIAFLTFKSRDTVRRIETYPPGCFNSTESSIRIYLLYPDFTQFGNHLIIKSQSSEHSYQGTLVQLEFTDKEIKSFIVASVVEKGLGEGDKRTLQWKWCYWQVTEKDAATILRGGFKEDSAVAKRASRAIDGPQYERLTFQTRDSSFSISMAKTCLYVGDNAICHMHLG